MEFLIMHDVEQGDRPDNSSKEQEPFILPKNGFRSPWLNILCHWTTIAVPNVHLQGPGATHNSRYRQQSVKCHHSQSMWIPPVVSVY